MNLQEANKLVEAISAIDNRQVTVERVKAWHEVLERFEYWECREALTQCRQDPSISYLEPKHIVAKVMVVRDKAETDARRERSMRDPSPLPSSPMPKCLHGIGLIYCDPCCRQHAIAAGLIKA